MRDADVFLTNDLQEKYFEEKQPDIFMYSRVLPEHHMGKIKELQNKYGFKICVDVDDFWELDPHHILYDEYIKEGFAERQIRHIKNADFIFTTHIRLLTEIHKYNENVYIAANAIPKSGQFIIEREPHFQSRLFWQGSDTHREDIAILRTVTERLNAGHVRMVMSGYAEGHEHWHDMVMNYTANLKHSYKLIPFAPVTEYYSHYSRADICLVPLVKSRFNSYKSNLKVLEAANLGLPVIASQVDPYLDMPLLYCKCGNDWVKHIVRLVKSRKRQKEAGQELKEFCDENYNFEKINNERRQVLEYYSKVTA